MARYVDSALSEGEPILYDAKVHWAIFLQPFGSLLFYGVGGAVCYYFFGARLLQNLLDIAASFSFLWWVRYLTPSGVAIGALSLLALSKFAHSIVYYFNSDFVLTDRRVVSKFGLLSRSTSEQRLSKVESIQVYQSLLGRLLNYGNVAVTGTGSSITVFAAMVDPIGCRRAIEKQLDRLKAPAER